MASNCENSTGIEYFLGHVYYICDGTKLFVYDLNSQEVKELYNDLKEAVNLIQFKGHFYLIDAKLGIIDYIIENDALTATPRNLNI